MPILFGLKPSLSSPTTGGGRTQYSVYVCTCDATDPTQGADEGVNSGVVGSSFVMAEALDKQCHLADWEHYVVVGAEQRDRLHEVAVLLVPERH